MSKVAQNLGLSKQAVYLAMRSLIEDGVVKATGRTRGRRYRLASLEKRTKTFPLDRSVDEDDVYRTFVEPLLQDRSGDDDAICHYGVTEIVNNAIDHSGGKVVTVTVELTHVSVHIEIADDGVGIFQKIAAAKGLPDPRQSLLEISKGKFTTDPDRHTGEGLFFASRAFDRFVLRAGELAFIHTDETNDWLLRVRDKKIGGTTVQMSLLTPTQRPIQSVFDKFSSGADEYRFSKTHVPLDLATFGDESLVSRSSAKRVLARVDRFDEVLLDFAGVKNVGQAFADEIFRVFAKQHPSINLISINANEQVTSMIRRAKAARDESRSGPSLFE